MVGDVNRRVAKSIAATAIVAAVQMGERRWETERVKGEQKERVMGGGRNRERMMERVAEREKE